MGGGGGWVGFLCAWRDDHLFDGAARGVWPRTVFGVVCPPRPENHGDFSSRTDHHGEHFVYQPHLCEPRVNCGADTLAFECEQYVLECPPGTHPVCDLIF